LIKTGKKVKGVNYWPLSRIFPPMSRLDANAPAWGMTQPQCGGKYLSALRQGMGSHVFLVAVFAAEEDFLSPEGNNVGLVFGDITLADWVLHQFFSRLFRFGHFALWGKEGALDYPVGYRQKDKVYDYAGHNL
jgi:hypothetical protein